jgi:AcrR family transcriptional regulator
MATATSTDTSADFAALVPGGTEPPEEIPPEIFQAALATYRERRRLDMRALAADLGIGRATLYRKVGNRDRLLGEVMWYLTRVAMYCSLVKAKDRRGAERVVEVLRLFMSAVNGSADLRHFLEAEPEAALRVLTSKHGPVQPGVIEALESLLTQEEERGNLRPTIDRGTLAYVIVRIGEGFLYADVIADQEPDVDAAVEVVARLLREP